MCELKLIPTDASVQTSTKRDDYYSAILYALGLAESDLKKEYARLQSRPLEWLAEHGWVRK